MTMNDPAVAGITIVDVRLGTTPVEVGVERGGTFEFRNLSEDYPHFEIVFAEPGPPAPRDVLTGSIDKPILVHMPDDDLSVEYYIIYSNHRHHKRGTGPYRVRSCPGCGSHI